MYEYSSAQIVAILIIVLSTVILTIYITVKYGPRLDYAIVVPVIVIFIIMLAMCDYIIFPPGSENALRREAEKIQEEKRRFSFIEKAHIAEEKKEEEIQKILAELKIRKK